MKHIYLQGLGIPRASTLAVTSWRFLLLLPTQQGWYQTRYLRTGCAVLSSLTGQSHMRTEPFQVLPPPTLCVAQSPHLTGAPSPAVGSQGLAQTPAGRAEMPPACPGRASIESSFQNNSTLATTRSWNSESPLHCIFSNKPMFFQGGIL